MVVRRSSQYGTLTIVSWLRIAAIFNLLNGSQGIDLISLSMLHGSTTA
jgi:hypothetical protein